MPQLFACLVIKEQMKRSYRGAEALLRDSESWLRDIGLNKAPDHNTLCRAARYLLGRVRTDQLLDKVAQWAAIARMLGLSAMPLALDSTYFESHHVSRHYERRCHQTRKRMRAKDKARKGRKTSRSQTVRGLPKLGLAVASACHVILSSRPSTGMGADQPLFEPLTFEAWRRVHNKTFGVVADAGLDSEANHQIARRDLGLRSLMACSPFRRRARRSSFNGAALWGARMGLFGGTSYDSYYELQWGRAMGSADGRGPTQPLPPEVLLPTRLPKGQQDRQPASLACLIQRP